MSPATERGNITLVYLEKKYFTDHDVNIYCYFHATHTLFLQGIPKNSGDGRVGIVLDLFIS